MALAHSVLPLPLPRATAPPSSAATAGAELAPPASGLSVALFASHRPRPNRRSALSPSVSLLRRSRRRVRAVHESGSTLAVDAFANIKHILLPITDRNPYLSEGTRQAAATTTSLAKKYGSDITVVVIDDKPKESIPEHDAQLSSIRWHLSEGGFKEFGLMERLGEGKKPTAIIGEVADDLNLDLVVLSMEAIHSKHVDGNLLAEFIPCPVLLLPL
ncbi:uncharacterized protein LOC109727662 [Ananas comosus]|uniref:Uncharacterized protein LOC109727662 n=1 Tax=Ananas comosus TaxID=4615 RepID=A0A6P5GXM7_ANACO|nr:uncharacterized protein LOC109727662 [Ananas comosus]